MAVNKINSVMRDSTAEDATLVEKLEKVSVKFR